ncbi:MAG: terminase large subunit domain-containing protein, partial [Bryobacteraceae bacterium]
MPTLNLNLPAPHPGQQQIIAEAKRFNVVCCGRRFGKTQLGVDRLVLPALHGAPCGWFSPTYKYLAEAWRDVSRLLAPVTQKVNQQEHRIELIQGGVVDMWSLDSPDPARGRKYKIAIVDEAALVKDLKEAWQSAIRPTLSDLRGDAWFLSTPRGMGYFKFLFDSGQDPTRKSWASWQMPTEANPFIDPEEIEAARLDITEAAFNQEYLAQFVNWEGAVFRKVLEAATAARLVAPEKGHEYIIGCDWGKSADYTVFAVLDTTTNAMVEMVRTNQVDYTVQRGRLRALNERWKPLKIIAESNSIGVPIIEELIREGLPVHPFQTTNASKTQAIEALALAFEQESIRILNDPVLLGELQAYVAERLPSGLMRYQAPPGAHDDTVMALAMAWTAVAGSFADRGFRQAIEFFDMMNRQNPEYYA